MKINFKITTECPAKCICCRERLLNFKKYSFTEKSVEELFDKIIYIYNTVADEENHLSITGGEPTLIPNLSYYIKKMTEYNISVGIDTNGWNISWEWLKEMEEAGLKYILLSVYSLEKENYDYLRGTKDSDLYERLKVTLGILKKYKENGGSINIRLQTVLMKPNYKELPDLLELAILYKFDSLSTAYYISLKPQENILMNQLDIECFIRQVCPEMIEIMKKCSMDSILIETNKKKIESFFNMENVPMWKIAKGIYRSDGNNCGENNRIAIYPNGVAVPCLGFDYCMDESYALNIFNEEDMNKLLIDRFERFWIKEYILCSSCSSGHQVWLDIAANR